MIQPIPRTWLFVPGDRPDRIPKALALPTDAVVVDLEDAVADNRKVESRETMRASLEGVRRPNVFVRINGVRTSWWQEDVESLADLDISGVVLPMAEEAHDVTATAECFARAGTGRWIVPILETAAGIASAFSVASADPSVLAVAFGGGDYSLDLQMPWPGTDPLPFLVPRVAVVQAARRAGLDGAIDTPNPTLQDMAIFADDVRAGASLGFRGKFAIHPRQVAVINELYSPTQDDIARATNIWESFERATANGSAAISVDGEFVDYAIALRAKALLARAAAAGIDVGGGPR